MLKDCRDPWTLQTSMPALLQITACVHVRVVTRGRWVAFSYSLISAPAPELGLEGDRDYLYGWLLRDQYKFPLTLSLKEWHRVCLRWDARLFSLEVSLRKTGSI